MNAVIRLIDSLLPNGARFESIGNVAIVGTGSSDRKNATDDGKYPFYVRSREVLGIDSFEFDEEAILIPGEGGIGEIFHYVHGKYALHQRAYRISFTTPQIDVKFAYYYFAANFKKFILAKAVSATVVSIRKPMITDFRIPIPPLEVQREIVRILDQFTQLEAELEAELEARRAQYDHYRSLLLNSHYASEKQKEIKEVLDLRAGRFIAASRISGVQDEENRIPCFGGGGLRGFVNEANQNGDHVLIGRQGALCGNVKRALGEFYATEHAVVVSPLEELDMSWVYHKLASMKLNQYASKSAQPGLAVGTLNKLEIRIPPLSDQKEIGRVLDSMDSLVNDLERGLPAELKARRQQYAYYRDRLLTFKEVEVEA